MKLTRAILEFVGVVVIVWLIFGVIRNERISHKNNIYELKKIYDDSVSYYLDKLDKVVASKEVIEIEFHQLQELDSAKFSELTARYETRLRQVAGSSSITIKHDTVKIPEPFIKESFESIGLVEYEDSCLYAGLNFTDSGAYMNYLIAAYDITSTILQKDGKIINDVNLSTPCGQIAQVKTFIFAPEPKKWFQKPLVVGAIGLVTGTITGIIIAK